MPNRHPGILSGWKMKKKFFVYLPFVLVAVALLAFLLREVVHQWIILPLARFIWLVKGYYGASPQVAYWVAALVVAGLVAFLALRLPEWGKRRKSEHGDHYSGSVQEMSFWIQRAGGSIYPKWHVAHLLATLALDVLDRRGTRQKNARLVPGPDWSPPPQVKAYLDAGLTTSYTQYPKQNRFGPPPSTPFDQDLEPVIKYLESLLESEHDHNS
jgi:hypothetical protein